MLQHNPAHSLVSLLTHAATVVGFFLRFWTVFKAAVEQRACVTGCWWLQRGAS